MRFELTGLSLLRSAPKRRPHAALTPFIWTGRRAGRRGTCSPVSRGWRLAQD